MRGIAERAAGKLALMDEAEFAGIYYSYGDDTKSTESDDSGSGREFIPYRCFRCGDYKP